MLNQLFYGNNLDFLRNNIKDDSIDLCYIDPPFYSQRNYHQKYHQISLGKLGSTPAFMDIWIWDNSAELGLNQILDNYQNKFTTQSIELISGLLKTWGKGNLLAYLVSITLRVVEINRILKSTGSLYLHCDPTASHYLKLILDTIFYPNGGEFQNEIIWCYSIGGKSKKRFGKKHDVILFYTKSDRQIHTFNVKAATIARKPNSHMKVRLDTNGREYQEKTDKKTGKVYQYYLDEGKIAEDYWLDIETLNREDKERLGYPTQKPEALLERIIKTSSHEGDIVLDAYGGCGTTLVVSQRLNRRWIGIDITYQSISLILKRFEDNFGKAVLDQIALNGIPLDIQAAASLANIKRDYPSNEFVKWAIFTYTNNRALINHSNGLNGIVYFVGNTGTQEKIIFQVKSDQINLEDIGNLYKIMDRDRAAIAILITLQEPTLEMLELAKKYGVYQLKGRTRDRLEIVTIRQILDEGKRFTEIGCI